MTGPTQQGAWGYGLATLSEPGDRVLDTWFPEPQLGLQDVPGDAGTRTLGPNEGPHDLAAAAGSDERRGVRTAVVLCVDRLARRAAGRRLRRLPAAAPALAPADPARTRPT